MKSKKTLAILVGLIVCLLAVALVLFLTKRPKAYLNAMPEDAKAMAMIDLNELASETGLKTSDMLKMMSRFGFVKAGIDITKPLYGFASRDGYLGLLGAVDDKGVLEDFFQEKGLQVESQRGLKWVKWKSFLMAFDKSKALFMGPVSSSDVDFLHSQMAELMKQEAHDNPLLQELSKSSGVVSLAGDLDIIPAKIASYFTDYLPNKVQLDELGLVASLRTEGPSLFLEAEMVPKNNDSSEAYNSIEESLRPIQGKLVDVGPSSPFLWVGAGMKGEKVLDLMRKHPQLRTLLIALNMCVDVDMMIRSIDGDVSLVWPKLNLLNFKPLFTAELKNKDFLRNVDDWKTGIAVDNGAQFRVLKDNDFYLSAAGTQTYFGVRNDLLYVTSSSSLVSEACLPSSKLHGDKMVSSLEGKLDGAVLFATLNVSSLLSSIAPYALMLGASPAIYEALDAVERVNLSATDTRHYTFELQCKRDISQILNALFAGLK